MPKKPKTDSPKDDHAIEKLHQENAELKNSLSRLAADFDNFRKRKNEEQSKSNHLATNELIMQIFPILDNFRRASEHAPAIVVSNDNTFQLNEDDLHKISAYFEGVRQIEKQLEAALQSAGLTRIDTLNQQFGPHTMEAIAYEAHPELPEGTVIDEVEGGYKLGDKVIRCAKVRVSSGQ